jgi:predicted flap endonuclease-1-like 5' DNA nuclease
MGTSRRAPAEETVAEGPASDAVEEYPKAGDASIASDAVSATDTAQASERLREVDTGTSPAGGEEQWVVDGGATSEPLPDLESEQEIAPSDPAPEPAFVPAAAVSAPVLVTPAAIIEGGDDFQRIRAIDVDIEQKLKARGITYFEHIAGWSSSDIRRIGQELEIPGRIDREQWIEQAQILAKGGDTYYSRNRKAMLGKAGSSEMEAEVRRGSASASVPEVEHQSSTPHVTKPGSDRDRSSGVVAASQGRSVAEMAAAAAAAIAAASASVTRGLRPIEPISPLSKVDPKISIPARITDAIREKKTATATVEITKDGLKTDVDGNGSSDDLKRIRGVGVLIEKRLNAMGIRRYEQIANWTSGDIDRVSRMLEFKGRIERESWVEQARILASGGQTEFSRRVDKGEVDTSRET